MDYFLTDEQKMIKEVARRISDELIVPKRAELDEKEIFPRDILEACGEAGLYGACIPEEYGGSGGGVFENCLIVEELSRGCLGVSTSFAATFLGSYPILLFGSEEQKKKYLPKVAEGKMVCAFALTEAEAGSDVSNVKTRAVKDGNHYVLNGVKQWITNGGEADLYTVIAVTNPEKGPRGMTAFIVEAGTQGLSFGKKERKMGIRASATREVIFEDCKVPKENVLGREGLGFLVVMKTFDRTRPGVGAQAVGVSQAALDYACQYARSRVQFGRKIISFQAIQHMLADMATMVEAARALVYSVARSIDANPNGNFSKESAMAKAFASDVAMKVTTDAVQVLGGYGYMKDYPLEKMMRDAKILQIYEGTNQIQRNVIALELSKEYSRKRVP